MELAKRHREPQDPSNEPSNDQKKKCESEESDIPKNKKGKTFDVSSKVEEWKQKCKADGTYLFNNERTNTYLWGSTRIVVTIRNDKSKKECVVAARHIVQGPYYLTNTEDYKQVDALLHRLKKLHQLEMFQNERWYHECLLVLKSSEEDDRAFLLWGYGGDKESIEPAIFKYKKIGKTALSARACLRNLAIKHVLDIPGNHLGNLFLESGSKIHLAGLDVIDGRDYKNNKTDDEQKEEIKNEQQKKEKQTKEIERKVVEEKPWCSVFCDVLLPVETRAFECLGFNLQIFSKECVEYLAMWRDQVIRVFGEDSLEIKKWIAMEQALKASLFSKITENVNLEKWGWPVRVGDRVMVTIKPGSKETYSATMVCDDYKDILFDECFGSNYRKVKIDDRHRHIFPEDKRHHDFFMVDTKHVRPMTGEELKTNHQTKDADGFVRMDNPIAYFTGDIVKIYSVDVNDEIGNQLQRNKEKLKSKPEDVGLVIDDGTDNRYWRMIFHWKAKCIRSIPCRRLFWLGDNFCNGRALRVPNIKQQLEEDSPLKILRAYIPHFEHLLT